MVVGASVVMWPAWGLAVLLIVVVLGGDVAVVVALVLSSLLSCPSVLSVHSSAVGVVGCRSGWLVVVVRKLVTPCLYL